MPGNPCYNIQFALCDEIKAYLTGYVRSGDTYTANGAAGWIEVYFSGREDHQYNENRGDDTLRKVSISRDL